MRCIWRQTGRQNQESGRKILGQIFVREVEDEKEPRRQRRGEKDTDVRIRQRAAMSQGTRVCCTRNGGDKGHGTVTADSGNVGLLGYIAKSIAVTEPGRGRGRGIPKKSIQE